MRYHFAIEIARVWLKVVENLKKTGRLEEFKKQVANRTMVGEYVSRQHQHLVSYSRETILFYALVDHNSGTNCGDPAATLALFAKYGLDAVSYESKGICKSIDEMRKILLRVYIETAKASLYNEEEGVVMYIVKRGGSGKDCTLSLCKVKTLEYRLYRRLREMLRNQGAKSMRNWEMSAKNVAPETVMTAYKKGCNELLKGILGKAMYIAKDPDHQNPQKYLPMPLEYYEAVGKVAAFRVAALKTDEERKGVGEKYVDFCRKSHCANSAIDSCMSVVDGQFLAEFVSVPRKAVVFIAPPYGLSSIFVEKCAKKFPVQFIYDLADKSAKLPAPGQPCLLRLYEVPDLSKLPSHIGANCVFVISGYTPDETIKTEYMTLFEKVHDFALHTPTVERLNKFFSQMRAYQTEAMFDRNARLVDGFVKQAKDLGLTLVNLTTKPICEGHDEAERLVEGHLASK